MRCLRGYRRLPASQSGNDGAVSSRRETVGNFPGQTAGTGAVDSEIRGTRVPGLPHRWRCRTWLSSPALRRLWPRSYPGLFVQTSWLVSELWWQENVGHGGAPRGQCVSMGSRSSMGSLASLQAALSHGLRFGTDGRYPEHLCPVGLRRVAAPRPRVAWVEAIPVRRCDVRATLQQRSWVESPFPHGRP